MNGVLGRQLGFVTASLAALLAVVALAGCGGGGGGGNEPTAAQLYAQQIQVGTFTRAGQGVDPDEQDRSGSDVTTVVRALGHDRYQIIVQSVSDAGFINSFWWQAKNLLISSVTGSSSGSCHVASATSLQCTGLTIKPPKCTCEPGGTVTVSFVARNVTGTRGVHYGTVHSILRIGDVTPVPYHIPSYKGAGKNEDLPICARGQQSTSKSPCVHAT
jgi:hypothetical protein